MPTGAKLCRNEIVAKTAFSRSGVLRWERHFFAWIISIWSEEKEMLWENMSTVLKSRKGEMMKSWKKNKTSFQISKSFDNLKPLKTENIFEKLKPSAGSFQMFHFTVSAYRVLTIFFQFKPLQTKKVPQKFIANLDQPEIDIFIWQFCNKKQFKLSAARFNFRWCFCLMILLLFFLHPNIFFCIIQNWRTWTANHRERV